MGGKNDYHAFKMVHELPQWALHVQDFKGHHETGGTTCHFFVQNVAY